MKAFIMQIFTGLRIPNPVEWGRLIAVTGSSQALIQLISFASGILIIRFLPTQEYALYTLATAIYTNMIILADSGIKTSVMAEGGKVWQDRKKLGKVIATGFELRKLFATVSVILSIPVMLYLLRHHGADWWTAIGITLAILPAFFASLSGTLLEIIPKLHQSIPRFQKIQMIASAIRVAFILIALYFFPYTILALLGYGLSQIWANKELRKLANSFIEISKQSSKLVRKRILEMVKRLMPESIYLCISGQITVWLISIFGSTQAVAQVGALGRLAMALSFFGIMFGLLISPRFSRLAKNKELIFKRFVQIQIGLLLLGLLIISGTWIFSSQMLWVLGEEYSNLDFEIILLIIGNFIGLLAVSNFYLCTSRGWVINPLISIPLSMAAIISGAIIFDVSSLRGVFYFNIYNNVVMMLLHITYGFLRISKLDQIAEVGN